MSGLTTLWWRTLLVAVDQAAPATAHEPLGTRRGGSVRSHSLSAMMTIPMATMTRAAFIRSSLSFCLASCSMRPLPRKLPRNSGLPRRFAPFDGWLRPGGVPLGYVARTVARTPSRMTNPPALQWDSFVGDTGIEPVTSSVSGKRATAAPIARSWCSSRWRRDLNPCTRLCRPLPRLSATPPLRFQTFANSLAAFGEA